MFCGSLILKNADADGTMIRKLTWKAKFFSFEKITSLHVLFCQFLPRQIKPEDKHWVLM